MSKSSGGPRPGTRGWLGVRLDKRLGWKRIAESVGETYRRAAPKKLLAQMDRGQPRSVILK